MTVLSYHERTKHRLEKYAAGPETLDWSMQPDPFRTFAGSKSIALPFSAKQIRMPFEAVYGKNSCFEASLDSVGSLLQLSMGLSAWKEYMGDRWALRCNPSSGNLHPTECYILALNIPGIGNGLHHYRSLDHHLEQRCQVDWHGDARLFIGLSSIHWREAWKYGERAFRYCQLDVGHALGSLRYAAALLGWRLGLVESPDDILGTQRKTDFIGVEPEEFDLFLEADLGQGIRGIPALEYHDWSGSANRIDSSPMYSWPIIEQVSQSTRRQSPLPSLRNTEVQDSPFCMEPEAVKTILGRRSAQKFDASYTMSQDVFFSMLHKLIPENTLPWDIWGFEHRVHPVFFIHRITGMAPGIYILPRGPSIQKNHFRSEFLWEKIGPLILLAKTDCRKAAKTLCCHQSIASESCFSLGMLAEFTILKSNPWRYRQLHWESGLMGQILYLEAEAAGLRGTGIGCFFDDTFHEFLGVSNHELQSVYHFTVGKPLLDSRITILPPYSSLHSGE
ncbi:nitroreductase family protein [Ferrovum myxofaciens]|uniref:Nitroreductase family protein n=1 Tax=Ferrovum myxofaciens TaxID=416213 RepID=A0A149VX02_9PROT|nr:SagB/ThcOx family dehydrogenase [Ferrovum myxofaciens]KXW57755.1 nitroreductase family protein [Ferrovum myxofaciens]